MSKSRRGGFSLDLDMSSLAKEVDDDIKNEQKATSKSTEKLAKKQTVGGSDGGTEKEPVKSKSKPKSKSVGPSDGLLELETDKINIWPHANRQNWEMDLDALTASIKANGQQQAIKVRKKGQGYELIFGRRRYEACKLLSRKVICHLIEADDRVAYALQQTENDERNPICAYSNAVAHKRAIEQGVFPNIQALAISLNKSRNTISEMINAYGNLDDSLVEAIGDMSKVSIKTAKCLNRHLKEQPDLLASLIDVADKLRAGQGTALIEKIAQQTDKNNREALAPLEYKNKEGRAVFNCKENSSGDMVIKINKASLNKTKYNNVVASLKDIL